MFAHFEDLRPIFLKFVFPCRRRTDGSLGDNAAGLPSEDGRSTLGA